MAHLIAFKFDVAVSMALHQSFALTMPVTFVSGFRACCVAGVLLLTAARAADQKPPLLGATREQVLAKFGEPKSQIVAGSREVLFFSGERIVLRNGVVVEAEEIPVETAPPAASAAATPNSGPSVAPLPSSVATPTPSPTGQTAAGANNAGAAVASDSTAATASTAPIAPPPQPEVIIKSVRPPNQAVAPPPLLAEPSAPTPAPALPKPSAAAVAASTMAAPPPAAAMVTAPNTAAMATSKAAVQNVPDSLATPTPFAPTAAPDLSVAATNATAPAANGSVAEDTTNTSVNAGVASTAAPVAESAPAKASAVRAKPAVVARKSVTGPGPQIPDATESIFTSQTYLIAGLIIAGGIGYLWWRSRQRQLALVLTAVSRSPFMAEPSASNSGARFTPELLAKLEWKRFEELVAAYYGKTGVVAARTKSGPAAPVHIKISWKGEPRPFACVQCVPHPNGLIDPKPLQAFCEAIAAEDIRRGYIVTTGKFSVPARDLAEEKHITLLSGDIFLEKLNALPDAARSELMRDATAGDYMTPTCPSCEARMARAPADPAVWQCPQCGTVLPK